MATHEDVLTDILLNGASFVGLLMLSVPVFVLDRHKKKLQKLKNTAPDGSGAKPVKGAESAQTPGNLPDKPTRARDLTHPVAVEKRENEVNAWKPWHRACLWAGYLCLLGASLVRLVMVLSA